MSESTRPEAAPIRVPQPSDQLPELPTGALPDPWSTPLEQLDVSDSRLYQQDAWRPYFERLRREDPVHFTASSPFGPYWSITRHADIREVESNHQVFSSFPTIAIGDSQNDTAMLEAADHALLIRSPSHAPPRLDRKDNVLLTEHFGPEGWNEGMRKLLQQLNNTTDSSNG